jgi:putative restriction endonuclease
MVGAERWLAKCAKLNVYRAKGGPAPHKPLLLLVILELAEQGLLPDGQLPLTPELAFRFCTFWNAVAHHRTQRPDVRLPFHHLHRDGFWAPLMADGKPSPDDRLTRCVQLVPEFVAFARDPVYRDKARRVLIQTYFQPDQSSALLELVGLPVLSEEEAADVTLPLPEEAKGRGREARFRLSVVAAYNYTCALTRYRLLTIDAGGIVDAAHIHQFSQSGNNDPRNGLALCKNAHWLFDNGLWTLADDYTVLVATGQFTEESPDQKALRDYHGRKVQLPSNPALWPSPAHLAWHRKHKFQGA